MKKTRGKTISTLNHRLIGSVIFLNLTAAACQNQEPDKNSSDSLNIQPIGLQRSVASNAGSSSITLGRQSVDRQQTLRPLPTPPLPEGTLLAPEVSGPTITNTATPTWTFSAEGLGPNTFRLKLDNSDLESDADITTANEFTPTAPLNEGSHTLYVQTQYGLSDWSSQASFTINIDLTPPAAPVVNAISPTNNMQPTWTFTGAGGPFRYKLVDADLTTGATETSDGFYTPVAPLTASDHTLYVQEGDAAGNWSLSGSFLIQIDTTPPPALSAFSASTGTLGQEIDLFVDLPADTTDIAYIDIRRIMGVSAPTDCSEGDIAITLSNFAVDPQNLTDFTPTAGDPYSYRVCIYDAAANVTFSDFDTNIISKFFNYKIFASSTSISGDFGGLAGADAICQDLAVGADRTGIWLALLSDSAEDARGRFAFAGNIHNTNGQVVTANPSDLWNAQADNLGFALDYDEAGLSVGSSSVWTGSSDTGQKIGDNCGDWTSNSSGILGGIGQSSSLDEKWLADAPATGCNLSRRLYCVNQSFPVNLDDFIADTGTNSGEIDLTIDFPTILDDYDHIDVRRADGGNAPTPRCDDAGDTMVQGNITNFGSNWNFTDAGIAGNYYSYRACVYDPSGIVIASKTVVNIQAKVVAPVIVLDNVTDAQNNGSSQTLTWNHNVGVSASGNSHTLLIVGAFVQSTSKTVTSIKFNEINLTKIAQVQEGSQQSDLWYLLDPPTGSHSIEVRASESGEWIAAGAMSFSGVNASPLGAASTGNAQNSLPSVNVASNPGEVVVDVAVYKDDVVLNPGSGQTLQYTEEVNGRRIVGSIKDGSTTVNMSWSGPTPEKWSMIGVSIRPSP